MEFFEEQYFRLNHILLSIVGLWPYDDLKVRYFRFILSLLIIMSFTGVQLIKLFIAEHNVDLFINGLSFNVIFILGFIRYISFYAVLKNIKKIRELIQNNWSILIDNQEIEIICKQGSIGKLCTIFIIVLVYAIIFVASLLQYISILLDIVIPLNESRPRKLLFPAEYFIDQQQYFYIITVHIAVGLIFIATTVIAAELFIFTAALHAFGLFKITSYRMKNILSGIDQRENLIKKYAIFHNRIIAAVDFHKRAIELSDLLKTSFGRTYLILLLFGVCSAALNLVNLFRVITVEKEIFEMIKAICSIVLHIVYFSLGNYAGQEFMDCDTHVYHTICAMKWYDAPLKIQKLILFLIQKTTKCYKVTAGGMFSPSLEGFATGVSMSISYFMVLRSI